MLDFITQARAAGLSIGVETGLPLTLPASTSFYDPAEVWGKEFLAFKSSQHFGGPQLQVSPQLYFRLTAWMGPPMLNDYHWDLNQQLRTLGRYVNTAYMNLLDVMDRPQMIGENQGVLWLDESDLPVALFMFEDMQVVLDPYVVSVLDAVTGQPATFINGVLHAQAYKAYQLVTPEPGAAMMALGMAGWLIVSRAAGRLRAERRDSSRRAV
jgi:hypothetical protein